MIIPLVLLVFLFIAAARPSKDLLLSSYCSIQQTQTIKGFFVLTIFFSHFCSYAHFEKWHDSIMQAYCNYLGQLMVVPFLFYSGYGIFESVKKKGFDYINGLPKKRILKVLLHFDFAVLLFLILDIVTEQPVSFYKFTFSLLAWESIGNSAWFIFVILNVYTFAYLGLTLFKGNLKYTLVFVTALSLLYTAIVSCFKMSYWYDTILAFSLGCCFSMFKDNFSTIIHKKNATLVGGSLCVFAFFVVKYNLIPNMLVNSQLILVAFCGTIIFFSLHIQFESKILSWFGSLVFEIYILQRIPMNLGKYLHWNESNVYRYFAFCFITTLLLAILFKNVTSRIDSKLFK